MITKYYKLDMTPFASRLEIPLNQYEDDFVLDLDLITSSGDLIIDSMTTASIEGIKADKTYYSASASIVGNVVTIRGDKQMTAATGVGEFEIRLTSDGKDLYSSNFTIRVEKAAMPLDAETSESVIRQLDDVKDIVQVATDEAHETAAKATAAAEEANTAASSANNAAAKATAAAEEANDALTVLNQMLINDDLSALEKQIGTEYITGRTGKVFARKIWRFATNTTSTCEAMMDTVGLSAVPSTDTVDGKDDFLVASPIFTWQHCNYKPDADGTKRLVALEGSPKYKTEGAVDVGIIAPTFYWRMESHATYDVLYMSDTPHPELALVPWVDAVKADGTVLPYYIVSAYASVTASDGLLRSQPGKAPAYSQSYQNIITNYAKKGTGYFGAGMSRNLHGYLFCIMKYGTKNVQKVLAGCTNFSEQIAVAVAETGVKRVLTTSTGFYAGCCISVGTGMKAGRGSATCNDIANRAIVKTVEDVTIDGKAYKALNLDIDDPIDTKTSYCITAMPCHTGQTDAVVGIKDGSYQSNTDAKHACRIHGCEYMWGQYVIIGDTMYDKQGDYWDVYTAPKGTARNANNHNGYKLVGKMPYNKGADAWLGDFGVDHSTGVYFPISIGNGDSTGTGDRAYEGGTNLADGTLHEALQLGALLAGGSAGFCFVACWHVLSRAAWDYASCD